MTYQLWQVFEGKGSSMTRYYVVNIAAKVVQSTWSNYFEAKTTMDRLNRIAKVGS